MNCSAGGDHDLADYIHTSEDGTTKRVTYCTKCGMEWG